jgi:hypothetical protein
MSEGKPLQVNVGRKIVVVPANGFMPIDLHEFPSPFLAVLLQTTPSEVAMATIPLGGTVARTDVRDSPIAYRCDGRTLAIYNSDVAARKFQITFLYC